MKPALLLQGCKCKLFTPPRVNNKALMPHLRGANGVACNGVVMVVMLVMVMVVVLVPVTVMRSVVPMISGVRVED